MIGEGPICVYCIHRIGQTLTCAAFNGQPIPAEIILNDFDHRAPHLNDNGLQFEEDPNNPMPAQADPFHPARMGAA
jgi:hypothetical protein